MKPRTLPQTAFLVVAVIFLITGDAFSQIERGVDSIWNDPVFKRQFIAGYGINSDIEPRVAPEEIKILEKIQPLMVDDLPKAEAALAKQVNDDSSAILDFTLGGIQFQQDKMADALVNYNKAVAKFPSFRRAWRNLGLIHVRDGKFDESIKAFTKMIELGGGDGYSYGLLGFAYSSKQDFQAAEAAYRNALLLQPDNNEWRLGLTQCVFKQNKFEDAATMLDGLIERYPDKRDFWILQAHTYLGMKQPLSAAQNLESLDRLRLADAASLHLLGDIYTGEQLLELAARAYQRAIQIDPQQPIARPLRAAEVLAARGALPQAKLVAASLRETLSAQLDENDQRKLLKLEARLSMAEGGGTAETAAVLEEIIKLDPLDGEALMLLGQHYSRAEGAEGDREKAIFHYERAASLESFEANAKIRHAQVLVTMGRYADAVPLIRRAQEVKPREDIARYLEQVERIARTRR